MNRHHSSQKPPSLGIPSLRIRNCRHSLTPVRARMEALEEKLDQQWIEVRCYATVEKDPKKLIWLRAEFEKRKRQAEAAGSHS
jgi:hypothetical protein